MECGFRIYYSDFQVDGTGREDWIAAPDEDVQVVRLFKTSPKAGEQLPDRSTGFVFCGLPDRQLFTGVDEYDPLETGHPKQGRLLEDELYWSVWKKAHGDR